MHYGINNPIDCPNCKSGRAIQRARTKAKNYSCYLICRDCNYKGPKVVNISYPKYDDYEVAAMAWNDHLKI